MSNTSDLILCFLVIAFLSSFMFKLPEGMWQTLSENNENFSEVASNYNKNIARDEPAYATIKSLNDIAPAAGNKAPETK